MYYVADLIFLLCLANYLGHYGRRWEFGRYGTPHSLVTPDAAFYLDGSPVDPLTRLLIQSQCEEELILGLVLLIAVGLLLLTRIMWRRRVLLQQLRHAQLQFANSRKQISSE